ncbi:hypothetical protein K5Z09_005216 [Escherichia coli]|nr:hypothetical protein [Escherichia coli]EHR9097200.1 hypothetical protein [Escherichia coli]EHR9219890.1 hypothetical protein [Escherichia coli]EIM2921224.1 hypothetical protein [Escherichia coli]EIM2960415.1 hypothetical protein [Escherichia coli]
MLWSFRQRRFHRDGDTTAVTLLAFSDIRAELLCGMFAYTCDTDDDYSSACLITQGRREDKCLSARAGKRPLAGGAERGRADAPPLSLRGRSDVCFCLFILVIIFLFFFFLLLSFLSVLLFSCLCLSRASP